MSGGEQNVLPTGAPADHRKIPLIVGLGVMLLTMDAGAIAIALPAMARSLAVDTISASLSITFYVIGMALVVPAGGWLEERFGGRLVFQVAILLTIAASTASAFAESLPMLVANRLIQGMAAGVLVPVGRLMVMRFTPRENRVAGMSTFASFALIGGLIGPAVGGMLVEFVSWRAIFFLNVPLGLIAFSAVSLYTTNLPQKACRPIDPLGILLAGAAIAAVVLGMGQLGHNDSEAAGAGLLALGALLLGALLLHARRAPDPLIRLALLRRRTFAVALVVEFLQRTLVASAPLLVALLLQVGRGISAASAGLVLLMIPVGSLMAQRMVARLVHRYGFRSVMCFGAAASGIAFGAAAFFASLGTVAVALLVHGLSRTLVLIPTAPLSFEDVEQTEMAAATSMITVTQQMSAALGIGVPTMLLRLIGGDQVTLQAIQAVAVIMGLMSIGVLLPLWRLESGSGRAAPPIAE